MVLPTQRAPCKSCSTHTAFATAEGCESLHVGLPQPVFQPATSITSLTAKHNPSSGPPPVGGSSNVAIKALLSATVIVEVFILTGFDEIMMLRPSLRFNRVPTMTASDQRLFPAENAELPAVTVRVVEPKTHVFRSMSFRTDFIAWVFNICVDIFQMRQRLL